MAFNIPSTCPLHSNNWIVRDGFLSLVLSPHRLGSRLFLLSFLPSSNWLLAPIDLYSYYGNTKKIGIRYQPFAGSKDPSCAARPGRGLAVHRSPEEVTKWGELSHWRREYWTYSLSVMKCQLRASNSDINIPKMPISLRRLPFPPFISNFTTYLSIFTTNTYTSHFCLYAQKTIPLSFQKKCAYQACSFVLQLPQFPHYSETKSSLSAYTGCSMIFVEKTL